MSITNIFTNFTGAVDDYYPCIRGWIMQFWTCSQMANLFVFMYNSVVKSATKFHNLRRWRYY